MSVHGEYGRYLSDLIDLLASRDDVDAAFLSALRQASLAYAGDLSKAAERALDALERPEAARLANGDAKLRELSQGLDAIARVILGRPSEA